MRQTDDIGELRGWIGEFKRQGKTVGLVPTMGYLHEGHLSLIDIARRRADVVVLSIFVNPTQFGPGEDFSRYPRDLPRDLEHASKRGADICFTPMAGTMYPEASPKTFVDMHDLPETLCGASRPGHFRGVMTVVVKFLNLVEPDIAVFGQKDIQQLIVIQRMVADLNFHVEIVPGPTVREGDGLAMSSRNKYLNAVERREAVRLYRSLMKAKELIFGGTRDARTIVAAMEEVLRADALRIDYVSIVEYGSLRRIAILQGKVIVAVAAFAGLTRLIDNLIVEFGGNGIEFSI